jgi:hypothetical protein
MARGHETDDCAGELKPEELTAETEYAKSIDSNLL